MARKRFSDHESFREISEEIDRLRENIPTKPSRPGRATVPYTEPGPTTHDNVTLLEREAEEAYQLLGELAPVLGNIAASAFPEPGRALDALNRVHAHLKTYEERYRKQGGGR